MPVRDLKSNVATDLNLYFEFPGNQTRQGAIVDTAHYESGVMFSYAAPVYADGTYTPGFEESDESGGSYTAVSADQLIGTIADATLTAVTSEGDAMPTIGLKGTKRFIRPEVVSTGSTGSTTIVVMTSKMPELKPVE